DGGTANGGVDTDETVRTLTIDVDPVNDAPTGTSSTLTLDEDETHNFVVGDFGFADPVEGHAFESVMIVNIPANGALMYNSAPVVNGQVIPVSNLASLQYTPVANASGAGYAAITFRVMDDGGTANGGVNTDETVRTLTIDVDSVNDAPSGQSNTIVVPEAREHRFSVADFGFSDSADGDELKAIRIELVPGAGSLLLGTEVVVNAQVILAADIPNLVFRPALNAYGVGYATLDFRVMDSGGTANGGIDTDPITHTLTIDVLDPVHAPVIADASLGVMVEDTATPPAATFTSLFGSSFSDADTGQSFAAVAIVGNSTTSDEGVWQFSIDGVNWIAMGDVTSSNALVLDTLTQVRFSPAVNFNGLPAALQVKALDSYYSGVITAPGDLQYIDTAVFGTDGPVSIDAALLSVQVTPVNDAPVLSADVVMPEITEDVEHNPGVLVADLFQPVFSDSLDQLDAELQGIAISANLAASTEGRWQYLSNGSWLDIDAVSGTESLVLSADSQIRFAPTENYHGIPGELQVHALDQSYTGSYSTPEARVILDTTVLADTSAYSHVPVTLSITVTPVPDAPDNLSLSATQVDENTAGAAVGSVTYNDVDESPNPVLSVDDPRFIIDNGLLRLAEGVSLDFEQESAITLNLELVDGDGFQIQRQVQLEVRDLNDAPQLGAAETSLPVVAANVIGIPENLFVDQDGDSLTYSVGPAGSEPLPAWLTFDTGLQAFLIESLPDKATVIEVEVTAEDPSGATETSVVVLQIAAKPIEVVEAPVPTQSLESLAVEPERVTLTEVEESAVEVPAPTISEPEPEPEPEPEVVAVQVQEPILRFEAAEQEVYSQNTNQRAVSEQNDFLLERLQDVDSQSLEQLFTLSDNEVLESFANLSQLMDEQYAQNSEDARFAHRVVGTTTAITSGFSVGYILWLIRGGTLIGSVLSALPAWRFIDPLPVLDSMGDDDESGDSESLQSMVAEQKPSHPAEMPDQSTGSNTSQNQPPANG
ncbi:MAG: hypothetical protein KTR33_10560, partial [Gammaproteobacteria bacterium]|nr:hypothetical protein [Gammaproteobacteria bacterium]